MPSKRSCTDISPVLRSKIKRAKAADEANPDIVPTADAAPQIQLIAPAPLNELNTGLPVYTVVHLNLEKVRAKKAANEIIYVALVTKPGPIDPSASSPVKTPYQSTKSCTNSQKICSQPKDIPVESDRALNTDVGMEVPGFKKLTCMLVRKSFLSCHALMKPPAPTIHMSPALVPPAPVPPAPVPPTPTKSVPTAVTATKVIVNNLQYRVTAYPNQKFCLATYDFKKEATIYDYSLQKVPNTEYVRLTVWKRPICRHNSAAVPEVPCKQCEQEVTVKYTGEVLLADLLGRDDLYCGNWGEVRVGAWSSASLTSTPQCPAGVHDLSQVDPVQEVVTKRFYNVVRSKEPTDKSQSHVIEFIDLKCGRGSLWHECCVINPNDIKDSRSLVECFKRRSMFNFADNVMREVEIMHYLGGHERRFVELESFGIDMHNLYVNSKLLSADLHDLLKRVEIERVTEVTAKRIMRRLLESTDYMHGRSVVHLDFKANNIAFCPTVVPTAELHDFISAVSCSSPVKNFPEKYFQYLEAVILDFGHAEWQPRAAADAEDPLKNKKRRDLRQLGRIFAHMIEGTNLSCDPDALCERLRAAPDKLLSDEGIHCLQNLLKEPEYTAAQALQLPWFDTN